MADSLAARLGDHHLCPQHIGDVALPACAPTILIGGQPAARVGDPMECKGGPKDAIKMGEPTVLLEGKVAARFGDATQHGGLIDQGCPTVVIGAMRAEAKRMRLMQRLALIDAARRKAAGMPPGGERDRLQAAADRLARNNKAVEHARLCEDVYSDDPTSAPEGWRRITGNEWPFVSPSGLYSALYQSEIDGSVVVAFRGTQAETWQDWVMGNTQGAGIPAPQYTEAVLIARSAQKYLGDGVEFTGHSLGGGLASVAAMSTGSHADTFNASGVSPMTYVNYGINPFNADNVDAYRVGGDILTDLQQNSPMPDAVGHVHGLEAVDMERDSNGNPKLGPDGKPIFHSRPDKGLLRPPSGQGIGDLFRLPSFGELAGAGFNPATLFGERLGQKIGERGKEYLDEAVHRHGTYVDGLELQKTEDVRTIEGML